MSFSHTKAVWQHGAGKVTGSRLLLWLFLAECANDDGVCWPSKASICEKTGFTDRTFRKALSDLEAIGAITIQRVAGRGIRYTVLSPTAELQGLPNDSESASPEETAQEQTLSEDTDCQKADCEKTDCQSAETAKEQGLPKDSVTPCQKTVGGLLKDSGGTAKRQPKPINNLSITYQEPRELDSIFSKTTSKGKPEDEKNVEAKTEVLPLVEPTVPQQPTKRSRKKAVKDCPFGFDDPIPDEYREIATAKAPKIDAQAEFTAFVCYYHRSGKQCADWSAAWRNWLIKAVQFKASKPSAPMPTRRPVADYSEVYDRFDDTPPF